MADRRKDQSVALAAIRMVRKDAIIAVKAIEANGGLSERRHVEAHWDEDEGKYINGYFDEFRDPDADEMVRLLTKFINDTSKFGGK